MALAHVHHFPFVLRPLRVAALAAALHHAAGALAFVLLPLGIWLFDTSLTSSLSFDRFTAAFTAGIGVLPGWTVRLLVAALAWALAAHALLGLRLLWLDARVQDVGGRGARASAQLLLAALALLAVLALALALRVVR